MTHQQLGRTREALEELKLVPEEPDVRIAPYARATNLTTLLGSPSAPVPLLAGTSWLALPFDPSQPIQTRLQRQILRREATALIQDAAPGREK